MVPTEDGIVGLEALEAAGCPAPVSITAADNEIGTVQPIGEAAVLCAESGVALHSDMTQAAGRLPISLPDMPVAYASISAHKICLDFRAQDIWSARRGRDFIREGAKKPAPVSTGGGQERGVRPGTLPVAACVGFGAACELAAERRARDFEQARELSRSMLGLLADLDGWQINGSLEERIPHNLSIAFKGVDAEALLASLPELAPSTVSACSAGALNGSETLKEIELQDDLADGTVRTGCGRTTTPDDVRTAAGLLRERATALRECAP